MVDLSTVGFGTENADALQFGRFIGTETFGMNRFFFSSDGSGTVGGVTFTDDDILVLDEETGAFKMYFDGSDVGISGDVNAFHLEPSGDILMSLRSAQTISGVGTVAQHDIVRFSPTQLGNDTAGSFSFFFDGSDVGLTTFYENLSLIHI